MNASLPASISLFPLDSRCLLLTNLVWTPNPDGVPSLHRQQLWVRFPGVVWTLGLTARFPQPVGRVCVETAEDEGGERWRTLVEANFDHSPQTVPWPAVAVTNLRVRVIEPAQPSFPQSYYFDSIQLETDPAGLPAWSEAPRTVAARTLTDLSTGAVEPFAGPASVHVNQQLGLCHDKPRTDRLEVAADDAGVTMVSPLFRMSFSRRQAVITYLGWDTLGQNRPPANLLATGRARGAVPVVARDGRRISSESCAGTVAIDGRSVTYRGISPVPELEWGFAYQLREKGFSVEIDWKCARTFHASELAALRIPFDLYRSVVNVLAMPDTRGPSGLVSFPLLINAPNHGAMRVTVRGGAGVCARILPLRVQGELWLDLIPGAVPRPSGMFEMPEGTGRVTLDFELTKVFPFGVEDQRDIFGWWEMPPFYSFAETEGVLGALMDGWLNGLAFRPDLGRFANNSVADSAAMCASYYADLAAYTPLLADGLDPRQFIRIAAEQMTRDQASSVYSNWNHFPQAATSPLDCMWLYVASTGDWEWARRWREAILAKLRVLQGLEYQDTGLIASAQSGIPEEGEAAGLAGSMQCQWADGVRAGHLESYVNAHAFRTLHRAADLLERLDATADAAAARAQAARLRANFLPTFHDPASGQIMQWKARDGRRFGFHSHMHLGAAVALGLVPEALAKELLREYLRRLAAHGFTRFEWGLPIFLDPIPAVCHNNWSGKGIEEDGSDQVGIYQNGAVHTHQTWYFLQALYRSGLRAEANRFFIQMTTLVRRGQLCGGLHSGVDWRHPVDGRPTGYEGLLAEQFHFLLVAITGYLGCELTIDGLVCRGPMTGRIRTLQPNFARWARK